MRRWRCQCYFWIVVDWSLLLLGHNNFIHACVGAQQLYSCLCWGTTTLFMPVLGHNFIEPKISTDNGTVASGRAGSVALPPSCNLINGGPLGWAGDSFNLKMLRLPLDDVVLRLLSFS